MEILVVIIVLLLLPVLYNLLFPFRPPNLDNYFSPGTTFTSTAGGTTQTILRQDGRKVYSELRLSPKAAGPPEHVHFTMDETGTVAQGTLTAKVGGQISQLNAGDRLVLPRGVYHQFNNETDDEVIVRPEREEDFIPVEFAYSLAQLYPLMEAGGDQLTLKALAKIAVLDEWFDTTPAGPPPAVFKALKKIIKPYARLFGVTPYDEKSRPGKARNPYTLKPNG